IRVRRTRMNTSSLEQITGTRIAVPGRVGIHTEQPSAVAKPSLWSYLGILTVFWMYVALSNVLYASSMQASLAAKSTEHFFAPWDARLLQHLVLYPVLLGCIWASLHIGWRPLWRTLPLQFLCAFGFAILASPALMISEALIGSPNEHHPPHPLTW